MAKKISKKTTKKTKRKDSRSSVKDFYELFGITNADTTQAVAENSEACMASMDEFVQALSQLVQLLKANWPEMGKEDLEQSFEKMPFELAAFVAKTLVAFEVIESYEDEYLDPDEIPEGIRDSLEAGFILSDFVHTLGTLLGDIIRLTAGQTEPILKAALEWTADHRKLLNGKILCSGDKAFLLAVYIAKLHSFAKVYWENHVQNDVLQFSGIEKYACVETPAGIAKVQNISYITERTILEEVPFDVVVMAEELEEWKSPYTTIPNQEDDLDQLKPALQEVAEVLVDRLARLVKKDGLIVDIECAKSPEKLEEWKEALKQQGLIEVSNEKPFVVNWSNGEGYASIVMYHCSKFEPGESDFQLGEEEENLLENFPAEMNVLDFIMNVFGLNYRT